MNNDNKGWKKVRLGEIADLITGFPFKGAEYSREGTPVVRGDNVTIGSLRWNDRKCWNQAFDRYEEYSLQEDDIVVGMDGSRVGRNRAKINKEELPLLLAQRVACIRSNAKSYQKFLYYHVFSNRFESYIKSVQTGTSIPHISLNQIRNFEISYPPLPTQQKIASILGSLDDKIELNNRMNANLEEQAQALYKRWFVDFEFPNEEGKPYRSSGGEMVESEMGLIPKGWKVGTLGEIASFISRGITPKYCDTSSEIVLNQKCIRDHKIIFSNARNHTPKQKNDKWLEYGDVLINSTGQGTLGRVSQYLFNTNNVTVDSHITIVRSLNRNLSYFLGYNLLGREKEIEFLASGSTGQTELSRVSVQQMDIVYPNTETVETFNRVIKPISSLMITNQQESQTLAQLRDSLLPKLMSGELEV